MGQRQGVIDAQHHANRPIERNDGHHLELTTPPNNKITRLHVEI